ncbi:E2/UBC family protein [Haloarchaeobius sp. TZWWS8]|uniref:E2/UBC family protein n=1 Tax=Haloarchaeobius sp. TZWWS8 TaxID=3446121 RepID=UPI003EBEF9C5
MSGAEFPPKLQQDAEYLREEGHDVELKREGNNAYALFYEFQLPEGRYNKETVTIL